MYIYFSPQIWDLSDPNGKGYLDKLGVFVGLKLVAFAQNGRDVSMSSILDDSVPEPEMVSGSEEYL
jgi:epidermal growth factor receptor substrate 15